MKTESNFEATGFVVFAMVVYGAFAFFTPMTFNFDIATKIVLGVFAFEIAALFIGAFYRGFINDGIMR